MEEWLENAALVCLFGVLGYLTGFIWMVQTFQYPAFREWLAADFIAHHQNHTRRITLLVAPAMILELGLSLLLFATNPLHLGLTVINWAQTFLVSVPIHNRLETAGKDLALVERLIRWNWVRTLTWTLHFGYCLIQLVAGMRME